MPAAAYPFENPQAEFQPSSTVGGRLSTLARAWQRPRAPLFTPHHAIWLGFSHSARYSRRVLRERVVATQQRQPPTAQTARKRSGKRTARQQDAPASQGIPQFWRARPGAHLTDTEGVQSLRSQDRGAMAARIPRAAIAFFILRTDDYYHGQPDTALQRASLAARQDC